MAQGFRNPFDAGHEAHGAKDVRRIAALPPAGPQQATAACYLQYPLKESVFRAMGQEAGAKFTQDGMVKAAISQVETEQVFQVDAGAHGIGSLAVGQAFHELHECDEGKASGRFGRLSFDRKQVGEVVIVE